MRAALAGRLLVVSGERICFDAEGDAADLAQVVKGIIAPIRLFAACKSIDEVLSHRGLPASLSRAAWPADRVVAT